AARACAASRGTAHRVALARRSAASAGFRRIRSGISGTAFPSGNQGFHPGSGRGSRAILDRMRSAVLLSFALLLLVFFPAQARADDGAVLLVAHPAFRDLDYRHTVLLAAPAPNGGHVGVILNRPTRR